MIVFWFLMCYVVVCDCYLGVIYYGMVTNADQTLAAGPLDFGLSERSKSFEQLFHRKYHKPTKIRWLCPVHG